MKMPVSQLKYLVFALFLFMTNNVEGQCTNCVEAIIEGPNCGGCSPIGWSPVVNTPDVVSTDVPWLGCVLDPFFEGNVMALSGVFPALYPEASSTILTGLTAGEEYLIGFKVYSCATSDKKLSFTIADQVFEYNNIIGYEEVIMCFTANSVDALLTIRSEATALGIIWHFVDSLPCSYLKELNTSCSTPETIPDFSNIMICPDQGLTDLPTISEDGFTGSWDGPVDFQSAEGENVSLTFNINPGQNTCLETYDYDVFIQSNIAAEFSLPTNICGSDTNNIVFPIESQNNLTGVWETIETSANQEDIGVFVNTFYPDPLLYPCASETVIEIEIIAGEPISFDLPQYFCFQENYNFPSSSLNNMEGTWTFPSIEQLDTTGMIQNIFTPNTITCDSFYIHNFTILRPEINTSFIDPLVCNSADGSILLESPNSLEYSIDGGLTWQLDGNFNSLRYGDYVVMYRYDENDACATEVNVTLKGNDLPEIDSIVITPITDCMFPLAQMEIIVNSQNTFEFSIDEGLTWQVEEKFIDLPAGEYELMVRYQDDLDCLSSFLFIIEEITQPVLQELIEETETICGTMDGQIEIIADGIGLEFSIDGGATWQSASLFDNLTSGTYNIVIQSSVGTNCQITDQVILEEPNELPEIEIEINELSSCVFPNGSVTVNTVNANITLEFSIDDGASWQEENGFQNLSAGNYTILYRPNISSTCVDSEDFIINILETPTILDLVTSPVSDCEIEDGSIEIISSQANLEYSIDNGSTWSNLNTFNNLAAGMYEVAIRPIGYPDCIDSMIAYIESPSPITFSLQTFPASCEESNNGSIEVDDTNGGSGNYTYSLDGSSDQQESEFYNLSPSDYTVYVSDMNNCMSFEEFVIGIDEALDIALPENYTIALGESLFLNPLINEESITSFMWDGEDILNPSDLIIEIQPTTSTEYTLTILYGDGCVEYRTVFVNVIRDDKIYLANIFNPNTTGSIHIQAANDFTGSINFFAIYDRWGNQVYSISKPQVNNPAHGWNGVNYGEGVYVYIVEYENQNKIETQIGSITLTR